MLDTTANHPWLTVDRGWQVAGALHLGEPVRLLDGGTATVVALQLLPGVGPMWDLSLNSVHTFAVGAVQAVVHNCPPTGDGEVGSGAHDLYHGTDIKSAKTMVNKGIDRAAADQYGGDGKFYTTTNSQMRGILRKVALLEALRLL